MNRKRVLTAMSGGVDSSMAVYLLMKQGYEVIGASMKLFNQEDKGIEDAKKLAQRLGIPIYIFSFEKEFEDEVINYFCQEYENGRTPNPCVVCNRKIKFGSLLKKAKTLGADYIATGHYVKKEYDWIHKRYILKKGRDKEKDQSYFLFSLSQEQLKHCLFPLGGYTKTEVRKKALELDLKIDNRSASQDTCFIQDGDYRTFLKERAGSDNFEPGPIVNKKGNALGEHRGIAFYTIGQRKGIGAHLPAGRHGKRPFYVIAIDQEKNTITVGRKQEAYQNTLFVKDINWIDRRRLTEPIKVEAKIRYKQKASIATVSPLTNRKVKVEFAKPQWAIAPGQAVVFYDEDVLVGGGRIEELAEAA